MRRNISKKITNALERNPYNYGINNMYGKNKNIDT